MSDPTSNVGKWAKLGWDDKSEAIVAAAKFITEAGKTNPDYAVFVPEWFPFYGPTIAYNGKMVDPDLIEPYVNAWIAKAFKNKLSFTAPAAKAAMREAGFPDLQSTVVANTLYHLYVGGSLPSIISNPSGWAESSGLGITDAAQAVKSAISSTLTITKLVPWILVATGIFVAWPYLTAARRPASMLGKIR